MAIVLDNFRKFSFSSNLKQGDIVWLFPDFMFLSYFVFLSYFCVTVHILIFDGNDFGGTISLLRILISLP